MKKHMKVMAALSTTALMAVFAPALAESGNAATVYAASAGWTEEDGGWVYYDSDGYRLTDTWTGRERETAGITWIPTECGPAIFR